MSTLANIDPVSARAHAEGQEGPRSAQAHEKREEAARPAVQYGGALSHLNETRRGERVNPAAITERPPAPDVARAREKITEPREQGRSARAERLADEQAAYEQRQSAKIGQKYDIEV
jgi:hypothetical protein